MDSLATKTVECRLTPLVESLASKEVLVRVLVTGAAGFIGAALVRRMLHQGHEVIGVDNFSEVLYPAGIKRARLQGLDSWGSWRFYERDLAFGTISDLLDGVNVVVNEAAVPGLVPSWDAFDAYAAANTIAVQRILRELVGRPTIHLVHASTSSVYGASAVGDENAATSPVSPYGVTKLSAENLIRIYREQYGVSASILRYFSVYGPGQRPDMAYALFCRAMLTGMPLLITGDGSQRRSNTYIDDVVDATLRAADSQIDGLVANICGASSISVLEAIEILADEMSVDPQILFNESRPGDQKFTQGDATRAHLTLGWVPTTPVEVGLRAQARAAGAAGAPNHEDEPWTK